MYGRFRSFDALPWDYRFLWEGGFLPGFLRSRHRLAYEYRYGVEEKVLKGVRLLTGGFLLVVWRRGMGVPPTICLPRFLAHAELTAAGSGILQTRAGAPGASTS